MICWLFLSHSSFSQDLIDGNKRFEDMSNGMQFNNEAFSITNDAAIRGALKILKPDEVARVKNTLDFIQEKSKQDNVDTFHTVNIASLAERYRLWFRSLPRITPFYAVKVNHHPVVVNALSELGTGFDCASIEEVKQIIQTGANPKRIIFANPRKSNSAIAIAHQLGVRRMTFDSIDELNKIVHFSPQGEYILRIKTDDTNSTNPLSSKFGVSLEKAEEILKYATLNDIYIAGLSFHVGSNNPNPDAYINALKDCHHLFNVAKQKYQRHFKILDMGGGWPGNNDPAFLNICRAVNHYLDQHFDDSIEIVAEPGRFFVTKTSVAVMKVIGKEKTRNNDNKPYIGYYLTNGAYGFFASSIYYQYDPEKIKEEGWQFKPVNLRKESKNIPATLWGPTCDSGDKIVDNYLLPELELNDYLYCENMGAYSYATSSQFNQITPSVPYYIVDSQNE